MTQFRLLTFILAGESNICSFEWNFCQLRLLHLLQSLKLPCILSVVIRIKPSQIAADKSPELYCQRCPRLASATDYTLLLVAVTDARRHRSSNLQLLPVSTKDITPPVFLTAPSASGIGESSFTLTVTLNEPGEHAALFSLSISAQLP